MADETFTKADIDAAVEKALEGVKSKNSELMDEVKKLKSDLRRTQEITPETLASIEAERDKAVGELTEARKQVGTLTKERDAAAKALETEQSAARTFALDAEVNKAIAEGGVLPALAPALMAMVKQGAKTDLVDGKYAVLIGDKPAGDHIKAFLDTDEGKHFRAAPMNSGGGAPGSGGTRGDSKTMTRAEHQSLTLSNPAQAKEFVLGGGTVINDAA
ncbi:MAG: hypothetical protein RL268_290 [Pseudomonadota bacterium]|jgi:hypothetical protein